MSTSAEIAFIGLLLAMNIGLVGIGIEIRRLRREMIEIKRLRQEIGHLRRFR